MQSIHFNTGRQYSREGQRISATLHDDGVVTFYDHDRMIDGQLKYALTVFSKDTVLRNYDLCEYQSSQRSRADGMYVGGANSVYVR
jgi:hypothetical protein